ncbi:MAG: hypothetical protein M1816_002137 [Peltula sp. TS41687]|nr:MAG: hypothetical protein M1816_002137 [Peltula sp. TS41687]
MDVFWAAPPVSRTLAAATLTTSVLVHSRILSARYIIYYTPWLFKLPPDLWRLVTPFLLTEPGLSIILDTYFLYTYGSSLETESPRFSQPGDFFTYLIFVGAVILIANATLLGGWVFSAALTIALAYTYAQDNRGKKVTIYIITIPVKYLPYALLLMALVTSGQRAALQQGSGLIAAHLYDFLTRIYPTFGNGRNYIRTPAFIRRWFASGHLGPTTRPYGTAFIPRTGEQQQPTRGPARGFASGFAGVSGLWSNRGPGRRLGEN